MEDDWPSRSPRLAVIRLAVPNGSSWMPLLTSPRAPWMAHTWWFALYLRIFPSSPRPRWGDFWTMRRSRQTDEGALRSAPPYAQEGNMAAKSSGWRRLRRSRSNKVFSTGGWLGRIRVALGRAIVMLPLPVSSKWETRRGARKGSSRVRRDPARTHRASRQRASKARRRLGTSATCSGTVAMLTVGSSHQSMGESRSARITHGRGCCDHEAAGWEFVWMDGEE